MSLQIKEKLYHGTISEIYRVDVTMGRGKKDFGKGFYMAVSRQQAIGIMHNIDTDYAKSLNMMVF